MFTLNRPGPVSPLHGGENEILMPSSHRSTAGSFFCMWFGRRKKEIKVSATRSLSRVLLGCIVVLLVLTGCRKAEDDPVHVRLDKRQTLAPSAASAAMRVCVGSMITPQDGYGYYRRLLDYIGKNIGGTVQALDPGNYREVNRLLENGKVDAAFVCGGPYVEGKESFGLELLVAPVVKGQPVYFSYLIVPSVSHVRTLSDLRGKTFAFTDPQSNSGLLVPADQLARMGETRDTFFRSYVFTYAHDRSIRAVADKLVDGAAVDSLVWDYLAVTEPQMVARTRIIARYGPFGIPPVVVNPRLDPASKEKLKQILLNVHLDPEGREILRGMHIERFVEANDSDYDSIRDLRRRVRAASSAAGRK